MKNLTLAIEDEIVTKARALAASRHTTLNAMIRGLLAHEVEQQDRIARAKRGIRELMARSVLEFEPGTNVKELSRSHDSDELHGHEHPYLGGRKKPGRTQKGNDRPRAGAR